MRAIVFDGSLRFDRDYPAPRPMEGEALVRVTHAGVCATDLEIIKGYMGFRGVLGHEFCGVVEACSDASIAGMRVSGEINIGCGRCVFCKRGKQNHCPGRRVLGILGKDGVFAQYATLPARNLHFLPDSVPDEAGVFVEPVAAAFEILRQVDITRFTRVCVIGDGRLGILAAQVISTTGCGLTVFGRHRENLAILDKRGVSTAVSSQGHDKSFDVTVECTGSQDGFDEALRLLRPEGTLVLKTTVARRDSTDLNRVVVDEIKVVGSRCGPFAPAIEALASGKIDCAPLVSGVYPLDKGVEAIGRAGERGVLKVILKMG